MVGMGGEGVWARVFAVAVMVAGAGKLLWSVVSGSELLVVAGAVGGGAGRPVGACVLVCGSASL